MVFEIDKTTIMEQKYQDLLEQAYNAFNARDVDVMLLLMDKDVQWPNGWEGGYVQGHDEVRDYWTRQWKEINPVVKPVSFKENPDGQIEVQVHQIVKDLSGNILFDGIVNHIYTFNKEKVKRMEIQSDKVRQEVAY